MAAIVPKLASVQTNDTSSPPMSNVLTLTSRLFGNNARRLLHHHTIGMARAIGGVVSSKRAGVPYWAVQRILK